MRSPDLNPKASQEMKLNIYLCPQVQEFRQKNSAKKR